MVEHTVTLRSIFKAKRQREVGIVLEELRGKSIPPEVVTIIRPLL